MTDKEKLVSLGLFFIFLIAFSFGWSWFIKFGGCQIKQTDIARMTDNQDDKLFNYIMYKKQGFKEESLNHFKRHISLSEGLIKLKIEHYKKKCERFFKPSLLSILKQYEMYLISKEQIFEESFYKEKVWVKQMHPLQEL